MSKSVKPWDIYARELFPIGYGHPLWMPEPNSNGREVLIGDVGWFKSGEFRPIFNSIQPTNQDKGVPRDFQVLQRCNLSIATSNRITQEIVVSGSITLSETKAEITASSPSGIEPNISGSAKWHAMIRSDAGALVKLDPPGVAEEIASKLHITNYMRAHFDSWLDFANSETWGLGLRYEDIIFVCGTLKTTKWAVAALQNNMSWDQQASISGQIGPLTSAGFSVSTSKGFIPTQHYRDGPPLPRSLSGLGHGVRLSGSHDGGAAAASLPRNQCLFIHYYKMKRRWLFSRPMQASAGPHQLPNGSGNEGDGAPTTREDASTYEFEPESDDNETYDPVTRLLDYILETSTAEIAIASDLDLIAMFRVSNKDREVPYNITEAIIQFAPRVEIDEHGVGTISIDSPFVKNLRDRDEQIGSDNLGPLEAGVDRHPGHQSILQGSFPPTYAGLPFFAGHVPIQSDTELPTPVFPPPSQGVTYLAASSLRIQSDPPQTPNNAKGDNTDNKKGVLIPAKRTQYMWPGPNSGASTSTHGYLNHEDFAIGFQEIKDIINSGTKNLKNTVWHRVLQQHEGEQGHMGAIYSPLVLSHDDMYPASAPFDKQEGIWIVENGLKQMQVDLGRKMRLPEYAQNGRLLVEGLDHKTGHLWDVRMYDVVRKLLWLKYAAAVTFITFSSDERLVAAGVDCMCYIWKTESFLVDPPLQTLRHLGALRTAAFIDNTRITTILKDNIMCIWNAETGEALGFSILPTHKEQGPWTTKFSQDGKTPIYAMDSGQPSNSNTGINIGVSSIHLDGGDEKSKKRDILIEDNNSNEHAGSRNCFRVGGLEWTPRMAELELDTLYSFPTSSAPTWSITPSAGEASTSRGQPTGPGDTEIVGLAQVMPSKSDHPPPPPPPPPLSVEQETTESSAPSATALPTNFIANCNEPEQKHQGGVGHRRADVPQRASGWKIGSIMNGVTKNVRHTARQVTDGVKKCHEKLTRFRMKVVQPPPERSSPTA